MKKTNIINKYAIIVHGSSKVVNIGDYIQALASSQFLPQIDYIIEREKIGEYDGEEIKAIMNAWYMYDAKQWPPSTKIHPLFISMHINKTAQQIFSTSKGIEYLKKYSPIGCRDIATQRYLESLGIKAYFSGCMTLTLGFKYKSEKHYNTIYFVDPAMPNISGIKQKILLFFKSINNYNKVNCIFKKKYPFIKNKIKAYKLWLTTVAFYNEYRNFFEEDLLLNAVYISQENIYYKINFHTDKDRLLEAERLIKLYSKAKLVVTSRIHCALPCTGLETPIIYILKEYQDEASLCRMDGLLQLFNVMKLDHKGHLQTDLKFNSKNKVSVNNLPNIRHEWHALSDKIIKTCKDFINNN